MFNLVIHDIQKVWERLLKKFLTKEIDLTEIILNLEAVAMHVRSWYCT